MKTFSTLISEQNQKRAAFLESENSISSKNDFFEIGKAILKDAQGKNYNESKADAFLNESIAKFGDQDFGKLIGYVQSATKDKFEVLEESLEYLIESIIDSPLTPRYPELHACMNMGSEYTVKKLAGKSLRFLELLNTTEYDTKPLCESLGVHPENEYFNYKIGNPTHLVNICEALENALDYVVKMKKTAPLPGQVLSALNPYEKYIDFARRIRINYTNDLNKIQGNQDSDKLVFDQFIRDNYNLYYFTPEKLLNKLNNTEYFVYLCLLYLDKFIDMNFELLLDRGFNDNTEFCSTTLKNYRDRLAILPTQIVIDGRSVNFSKLYNVWEVTNNLLLNINPTLRSFAKVYLTKSKPMIDSIRIYVELRKPEGGRHT